MGDDLIRRSDALRAMRLGNNTARIHQLQHMPAAALDAAEARAVGVPNPADTALKDGTMLRLLVDYSGVDHWTPLEDARQAWTIGYNTLADTGEDEWVFAGWNWEQDCFVTGNGKVIGWLPFMANLHPASPLGAVVMREKAAAEAERYRDMCGECNWPEEAVMVGGNVANDIAQSIRALPLPTDAELRAAAAEYLHGNLPMEHEAWDVLVTIMDNGGDPEKAIKAFLAALAPFTRKVESS